MLSSNKIISFVATRDPEKSKQFYVETLGLKLVSDEHFAVVLDANGTRIRVQKLHGGQEVNPPPYTVLGWDVPDIQATVIDLQSRGVAFQRYPGIEQDSNGIWTTPGGARVAWFKDPDGHTLSLTENQAA